ncbi:uncharacterized protein LOC106467087 isoform X3 [Limulus polyphemus]|uniref:Uncharacterized protein LOC106467087 isoform X3 n=1 Tax=Limulus polyphemus TaxID=6850 RepID=A0ABM1T4W0_LIMPO|nr:uncharacterized protein LOC106467087 isoform X3 [Limulus polyphemus]
MESRSDFSLERSRLLGGAGLHAAHGFPVDAPSPHPTPLRAAFLDMNRTGAATDPASLSAYHSRFLQATLPLGNNGTSYSYLSGIYSSNFPSQSTSTFRAPPTGIIMRQFWPPTPPPDNYSRYAMGSSLYTMFPPLVPSTDPNPYSSQGYISRLGQSPAHYSSLLEATHKEPTYLSPGLALASPLTLTNHVGHTTPVPSLTPALDRHPGFSHLGLGMKGLEVGRRSLMVEDDFRRVERGAEELEGFLKRESSSISCHHNAERARLGLTGLDSHVRAVEKQSNSSTILGSREKLPESRNKQREERLKERQQCSEPETHHLEGRLANGNIPQVKGAKPSKSRSVTLRSEADKISKEKKCSWCSASLNDNTEVVENPHCITKQVTKIKSTNRQEFREEPVSVAQRIVSASCVTTALGTSSDTVATTTVTFTGHRATSSLATSDKPPHQGAANTTVVSSPCHVTITPHVTTLPLPCSVPVDNLRLSINSSQMKEKARVTSLPSNNQSHVSQTAQSQSKPESENDTLSLSNSQENQIADLTHQCYETVQIVHPQVREGRSGQNSSLSSQKSKLTAAEVKQKSLVDPLSRSCSVALSSEATSYSLTSENSPIVTSEQKNHKSSVLPTGIHIKQERMDGEEYCSMNKLYSYCGNSSALRNDMTEEDHGVINLSIPRRVPKQEPSDFALPCQMLSESMPRIGLSPENVQPDFVSSHSLTALANIASGSSSVTKSPLQKNDLVHVTNQTGEKPKPTGKIQQSMVSLRFQLASNPEVTSAFSQVTTSLSASQTPVSCNVQSMPSSQTGSTSQQAVPISSKGSNFFDAITTVGSITHHHRISSTKSCTSVAGSISLPPSTGVCPSVSSCPSTCSSTTSSFPSTVNSNIPVGIAVAQQRQVLTTTSGIKGGPPFLPNTSRNRSLVVSSTSAGNSDNYVPEKEGFLQGSKELSSGPDIQQHSTELNLNNTTTCILGQDVNPPVTHWEQDSIVHTPLPQQWVTPSPVVGPTVWLSQNMYNPTPAPQPPPPTAVPYPVDPSHVPIPPGGYQVYRDPLTNQIFLLPTTNIEIVDRAGIWTDYTAPPCGTPVQQVFATQPQAPPFQSQVMQEENQLKHQTAQSQNLSVSNNCFSTREDSEGEERDESTKNVYQDEHIKDKTEEKLCSDASQPLGSCSTVPYPAFPQPSAPAALSYFYEASTIVHLTQTQSTTAIQTEPGKRSQGTSPMNPVTPSPPIPSDSDQGVQASCDDGEDSGENDEDGEEEVSQDTNEVEQHSHTISVTAAIQVDMDCQTNSDDTDVEERAVEVIDSANQTDSLLMGVVKDCSTSGEDESCDIPRTATPSLTEIASVADNDDSESQLVQKPVSIDAEIFEGDSTPVLSAESQPVMDFIDHHGLNLLVDSIEEFASRVQEENNTEMGRLQIDSSGDDYSTVGGEAGNINVIVNDNVKPTRDSVYSNSDSLSRNIDPSCTDGLGLLCALAEQRFLEESMSSQVPETGLNLSLKHEQGDDIDQTYEESNKHNKSHNSKSPSQVYAFSSNSSSPFYTLGSPLHAGNIPETMDAAELEMKLQLAELQKKYKLKQRELAKLQPKKEKEEPELFPIKRRPGRPRKRQFMLLKPKNLKTSPISFGDSSSEYVPELYSSTPAALSVQPSTFPESIIPDVLPSTETSFEPSEPLRKKKKKHSALRNRTSVERSQTAKKSKQNKLSTKGRSSELIMKKKANTKVKKSNLKLQMGKVSETFSEHQTEKTQLSPTSQEEHNLVNDCRVPNLVTDCRSLKTDETLENIGASTPDDTATKSLKQKNKTETKTTESEPGKEDFSKQRTESPSNKQGSFKLQSSKVKKNQNKRSIENKNPFLMSKQESLSSDSNVTEDPHEQFVAQVNISPTTPEKDTKRKLELGESECNTSDTEVSSAKKRKPGRPKKHSLSKSDEATETIVPKQPKKLAFLKAEAKRVKNSLSRTKNCVELESVTSFFEEDIWFRRRSERIFLHDAGVVPGAISLWQGESLNTSVANDKNLSTTETKKSEAQTESKSETTSKIHRNINKSGEVSHKKKTKIRKDPESTSKKLKTKTKESKRQQTKEKLVPDELFAALKKCRLSESNQGGVTPRHSTDQENAESSEGDNLPLSVLIEKTSNPVIRSCILQPEELDDQLRVLTMDNGLFYAGTIKAIRAPDVYGITRDGERGNRPHIYSREEILNEAIVEVKPNSLNNLPEGQRVCAFWSQQYRCMYPGTVAKSSSPNCDSDQDTVYVEFDDGDSGRIPLKDICMLPPDYPIVCKFTTVDSNPLMLLGKRRQHRLSGESVTDSSVNALAPSGEKVKTKKNKNKSKSGKKKSCSSRGQNTQDHSQLNDVFHSENISSLSSVISTVESQSTLYTVDTLSITATRSMKSSSGKEKEKNSQKKKSKKSKSESKSKVKDKSREKESHHIGSSSEASVCGPPSLKSRKHKKHKDDHKRRHRHHHHHCHHHHHHKKHKHEKRSHPSSPEHSHSPSSSSSDANTPNVIPTTVEQSTKSGEERTQKSPQAETPSSSTENKKSQLMVKIRTNSTDISQEDKKEKNEKETNKNADPESSSVSSSDSSESLNITDEEETTKTLCAIEEKSQNKKVKTKKSNEKKKRKDRLPSVEKSKIAAQQLWRWAGKSFRRANTKGKAKKEFFKAITRGKETIKVGDCAVFLSTGRPHLPYIGRIETMWQSWGGNMVVKVKWFYHPEETKRGSQLLEPKGALFQSPHMDENDVQTISHRCELLSWTEYKARRIAETSNENFRYGSIFDNNDIYYLAGSYDPLTSVLSLEEGVS